MAESGLKDEAFIYIGDSALVTEKNLRTMGGDTLFISRLPAQYKECSRIIKEAVLADKWTDLGVLSKTKSTKKREAARYRYYEGEISLYDKAYRALVIHSSANDKRRQKSIEAVL